MIGKKSVIALILLIAVLVCGCSSAPEYNITDDESDAIAQYCAYLLLKYDKNKNAERKLLDKKELEDIYNAGKEENVTEAVTPTPPITDPGTPTPTPTEAPEVTDTPTPTPEITEEPKNLVSGLTELYGKTDFTVEYGYYKLSEKYVENEYSVITPKQDGEKVLALYFLIKLSTFIRPCSPKGPPTAHIRAKTNNLSAISQYLVFSAPVSSSSSSSSSFFPSLFASLASFISL